jgi:hypothetical protein
MVVTAFVENKISDEVSTANDARSFGRASATLPGYVVYDPTATKTDWAHQ